MIMDYEKKYKETIEKVEKLRGYSLECNNMIDKLFPELKENENERIRKELIRLLNTMTDGIVENYTTTPLRDFIAWLEKQGEQKSFDSYCKEHCKGFQETGKCFADGECKAKREIENKPTQELGLFKAEHGKYYYCIKDYFSGGKKFASKGDIVQALRGLPIMSINDVSKFFLPVNNVYNPAWSEEDEKILNEIFSVTVKAFSMKSTLFGESYDYIKWQNWLKSLKDRVQPHWKPTDEQMQTLKDTINHDAAYKRVDVLESLINDLKKL